MTQHPLSPTVVHASAPAAKSPFTVIENVKGQRTPLTPPDYVSDQTIALSQNSIKVLEKRYLRRDISGDLLETPAGMFYRIAHHIAQPEKEHNGDTDTLTRTFYELLTERRFYPNSPTFTGAGTPLGQLAACFTADMRITTANGAKRIADLQVGDRVLTHQGRYRPVTELFQRAYEGELLRIKTKLIGTVLEVTPEHPILTPEGWVKAGELTTSSYVAIGVPVGVRSAPTFDMAESVYAEELELQVADSAVRVRKPSLYQNSGRQAEWANRFIEVTPDLARLCGYYVAEGTIGPDERYVRFTFNKEETAYQQDVINLLQQVFGTSINQSESNYGNWMNINLYSRAVAAWFRTHFDQGSSKKRIPIWLQYANKEIQEAFLVGLMRGDGLFYENLHVIAGRKTPKTFRSFRLTLGNPGLIQQVWQMCLRLGYDAAIRAVDTSYVTPNASDTAQISMPPLQSRSLVKQAFGIDLPEPDVRYIRPIVQRGEHVFFPIERIESVNFGGTVYNCEVDEDHSYITEGVTVHNCFVLPIEDDMGKSSDGIFSTLRVAALIQQTGGGNGFSFSRLRPKDDVVHTSSGRATGPVGFLRVYDQAFGEIAQGGSRRGANMAVLRVDHPDIEEFITCKAEEGKVANFNISVAITDEFMQAVKDDADFDLRNPRDGKVWKTVRARDLFDKIIKYAHHNGEPGALFIDAANRSNPVPHLYDLEATNPCGEQWLGPYENCCLGSVNLAEHVTLDPDGDPVVDWALLRRSVEESTHFLDNVVSINAYVPAVPQVAEAAYRARRIGLGIMGLGDMMYRMGIRYGSEEGQEFAAQIMEFVRYFTMHKSIELAEERGAFLAFTGSIYDDKQPGGMKWQVPQPITPYSRDWYRPALDWQVITTGIRQHGIRNAAQTTVAPTGTIATVCGCEGYGCEPVFALGYIRHFKDGDKDVELAYTSPLFDQALDAADLSEARKAAIKQHAATYGSCQTLADMPEHLRHTFVVSSDITAEEHVRMQAAIQAFVDNSISKCVTGDTLVLTANGLVPLAELSDMRLPDQFAPLDIEIVSPYGIEQAAQFYYGGYRETRKVSLEYGFNLEGTGNHRVHVLTSAGTIQFRQLDELQVGDTVVLYTDQQRFGGAARALPHYQGEMRTNSKTMTFPTHMSEGFAFLLGCITSEGAITINGVSITNNDPQLLAQLSDSCHRLFGFHGTVIKDKRNQVHTLQINSRALRNWLLVDLGLEAGAENKLIPTCILGASQPEIAAFLRGLFLDGYMTQDGKLFGITLASEKLIHQLQVLLLNLGVLGTVRQTTERAWNLTVQGGELEMLADQISFVEVWKNERIANRNLGRLQRYRNYSRLLPAAVTATLDELRQQSPLSLRALYSQGISVMEEQPEQEYQRVRVNLLQGHRMTRSDAQRVYQYVKSEEQESPYLHAFFAQDKPTHVYVEVQNISIGYAEVFDINVPGSHSFIANGLGNHNTCNFPEGATEADVAQAYQLAWELGCKGLTVYVTGSREQVVLETKATQQKKSEGEKAAVTTNGAHDSGSNGYANGATHAIVTSTVNSHAGTNGKGDSADVKPIMLKRPRPKRLQGSTYRKETPLGSAYITVNSDERNEPFEVFLNVGKAGSEVAAVSEAMGRLISLVLRMPASLPPSERLRWVMDEMAGIGGGRPLGFGANRVRSLPDGVAQVLAEHLSDLPATPPELQAEQLALPIAQRPIGDICPECGEASFLNVEGCRKCHVCGYSEC